MSAHLVGGFSPTVQNWSVIAAPHIINGNGAIVVANC